MLLIVPVAIKLSESPRCDDWSSTWLRPLLHPPKSLQIRPALGYQGVETGIWNSLEWFECCRNSRWADPQSDTLHIYPEWSLAVLARGCPQTHRHGWKIIEISRFLNGSHPRIR